MKFFEKLLTGFGYTKEESPVEEKQVKKPLKNVAGLIPPPVIGSEPPPRSTTEYLRSNISWVYACTQSISREVANIKLSLFQKKSGGDVEEITEHPALDVLYNVNNFTSSFDNLFLTQTYLELAGEAPWFLDLKDGVPQAILLLRPDKLTIRFDSKTIIGGYDYIVDETSRTVKSLKPEEVILFKDPGVMNPLRGESTLKAIAKTFNIDEFSEIWNQNFFYNSARPDMIVSTDQKLGKDLIKKIRDQWEQIFKGKNKSSKLAIMHSGLKAELMTNTAKDMDFVKQSEFTRDKILAIFGVPKSVLGLTEDVNRANAETAAFTFAKWTIKPKMQKFVGQLNEFYLPYWGDDLFFSFEDPVPEDTEGKIRSNSAAVNVWKTINEIRLEDDLEAIEGGDVLYIPNNIIAVGSTDEKAQLPPKYGEENLKILKARNGEGKVKGIEKDVKKDVNNLVKLINKNGINYTRTKEFNPDEHRGFWEAQIKISEEAEKEFIPKLRKIFKAQEKQVLGKVGFKNINKANKAEDTILNVAAQVKIFIRTFGPLMEQLLKDEGKLTVDNFGLENEFKFNKIAQNFLTNKVRQFSKEVNVLTNDKLAKTLTDGIERGEGVNKLRDRVRAVFHDATENRAEMIARTETSRTVSFATEQAYAQNGIDKKIWLTAFDERVCEFCIEMEGRVAKINTNFHNHNTEFEGRDGGTLKFTYEAIKHPPLHPRCRCSLAPAPSATKEVELTDDDKLQIVKKELSDKMNAIKVKEVAVKEEREKMKGKEADLDKQKKEIADIEKKKKDELLKVKREKAGLKDMKESLIDKYIKE